MVLYRTLLGSLLLIGNIEPNAGPPKKTSNTKHCSACNRLFVKSNETRCHICKMKAEKNSPTNANLAEHVAKTCVDISCFSDESKSGTYLRFAIPSIGRNDVTSLMSATDYFEIKEGSPSLN